MQAANAHAGHVAFLGLDAQDEPQAAEEFLRTHATPYDHVFDSDAAAARSLGGGRTWPTTFFYDTEGKLRHVSQGSYASLQMLENDISRYAVDG